MKNIQRLLGDRGRPKDPHHKTIDLALRTLHRFRVLVEDGFDQDQPIAAGPVTNHPRGYRGSRLAGGHHLPKRRPKWRPRP